MIDILVELSSLIGIVASVFIALFSQIIIHELGHLIFGLISGYTFSSFRIGSFMIVKENGKMKFKRFALAGTLGQCLMSPPNIKDGKFPVILYNLGGALLNIVTVLIFIIIYIVIDVGIIKEFAIDMIVFGTIIGLTNGIPIHTKLIDNDGYNAIKLHKNTAAQKAFWVQLKCNELQTKGVRIKDMPEEWFEFPKDEDMKNSIVAAIGVFACNKLVDEHKFDEADSKMEHILNIDSSISGIHKCLLICDRIYCELINKNRVEQVEKLYTDEQKKYMASMKDFPSIIRTEYALALFYEDDIDKIQKLKSKFDSVSKTYPYRSDIASERELMDIADETYRKKNTR